MSHGAPLHWQIVYLIKSNRITSKRSTSYSPCKYVHCSPQKSHFSVYTGLNGAKVSMSFKIIFSWFRSCHSSHLIKSNPKLQRDQNILHVNVSDFWSVQNRSHRFRITDKHHRGFSRHFDLEKGFDIHVNQKWMHVKFC